MSWRGRRWSLGSVVAAALLFPGPAAAAAPCAPQAGERERLRTAQVVALRKGTDLTLCAARTGRRTLVAYAEPQDELFVRARIGPVAGHFVPLYTGVTDAIAETSGAGVLNVLTGRRLPLATSMLGGGDSVLELLVTPGGGVALQRRRQGDIAPTVLVCRFSACDRRGAGAPSVGGSLRLADGGACWADAFDAAERCAPFDPL